MDGPLDEMNRHQRRAGHPAGKALPQTGLEQGISPCKSGSSPLDRLIKTLLRGRKLVFDRPLGQKNAPQVLARCDQAVQTVQRRPARQKSQFPLFQQALEYVAESPSFKRLPCRPSRNRSA